MVKRLAIALLVGLAALGAVACGNDAQNDALDLASDAEVDDVLSMAKVTVDRMNLPAGSTVVVPTNQALLALDADTLANYAAAGSIESLLVRLVVLDDVDLDDVPDRLPPELDVGDGRVLRIREEDGSLRIGAGHYHSHELYNDIQLIAIDRIW